MDRLWCAVVSLAALEPRSVTEIETSDEVRGERRRLRTKGMTGVLQGKGTPGTGCVGGSWREVRYWYTYNHAIPDCRIRLSQFPHRNLVIQTQSAFWYYTGTTPAPISNQQPHKPFPLRLKSGPDDRIPCLFASSYNVSTTFYSVCEQHSTPLPGPNPSLPAPCISANI